MLSATSWSSEARSAGAGEVTPVEARSVGGTEVDEGTDEGTDEDGATCVSVIHQVDSIDPLIVLALNDGIDVGFVQRADTRVIDVSVARANGYRHKTPMARTTFQAILQSDSSVRFVSPIREPDSSDRYVR